MDVLMWAVSTPMVILVTQFDGLFSKYALCGKVACHDATPPRIRREALAFLVLPPDKAAATAVQALTAATLQGCLFCIRLDVCCDRGRPRDS